MSKALMREKAPTAGFCFLKTSPDLTGGAQNQEDRMRKLLLVFVFSLSLSSTLLADSIGLITNAGQPVVKGPTGTLINPTTSSSVNNAVCDGTRPCIATSTGYGQNGSLTTMTWQDPFQVTLPSQIGETIKFDYQSSWIKNMLNGLTSGSTFAINFTTSIVGVGALPTLAVTWTIDPNAEYGYRVVSAANTTGSLSFVLGSGVYTLSYVNDTYLNDPVKLYGVITKTAAAVPEPGTLLLLGVGLAGVASRIRKRETS